MDFLSYWKFLPLGYLLSILVETPVLLLGLSKPHPVSRRLFAGVWLTACTYPIVILVFPLVLPAREVWRDGRWETSQTLYLWVAETFAPLAECLLFAAAFHLGSKQPWRTRWRDYAVIVLANLASFGAGEIGAVQRWAARFG